MSIRSSIYARAGLVALSIFMAACANTEPAKGGLRKLHGVALVATDQGGGHRKAIAQPETRIIRVNPGVPEKHTVVWSYGHLYSEVRFTDPRIHQNEQPVCPPADGTCTWDVPARLLEIPGKNQYKYEVTGKYDEKTDLDRNDPFIEVDR
ncbi:MAG TPA: hypothetical protein VGM13_15835 [Thermoanaerobaculia bacterium]|jgi:hypothetical protein